MRGVVKEKIGEFQIVGANNIYSNMSKVLEYSFVEPSSAKHQTTFEAALARIWCIGKMFCSSHLVSITSNGSRSHLLFPTLMCLFLEELDQITASLLIL